MADLTPAKAGMRLSKKAIKTLTKLFHRNLVAAWGVEVKAKADGAHGRWICIDCGHLPRHNMEAHDHAEKHSEKTPHRFAWMNATTNQIEEP